MAMRGIEKRSSLCSTVARDLLQRYATTNGPLKPPVRVDVIARWLGYQVVLLYSVGEEFSGLVSIHQRLIGVNGRHQRRRRRFSVAHELAHILLKHPPESHCTAREIKLYNAEADQCAGEILVPGQLLLPMVSTTRKLSALARTFDVSEEAMEVRLRELKLATKEPFLFNDAFEGIHPAGSMTS